MTATHGPFPLPLTDGQAATVARAKGEALACAWSWTEVTARRAGGLTYTLHVAVPHVAHPMETL